jgi:transposase
MEFGFQTDSIKKWILDAQEISDSHGETITVSKVRALKKELDRIKEENEILKLAGALLAKN